MIGVGASGRETNIKLLNCIPFTGHALKAGILVWSIDVAQPEKIIAPERNSLPFMNDSRGSTSTIENMKRMQLVDRLRMPDVA